MTKTDHEQGNDGSDEPLLDFESARFLIWPGFALAIVFALCAVVVGEFGFLALCSLVCFQAAWGMLGSTDRLRDQPRIVRMVSAVLWAAWVWVIFVQVKDWS